MVDTLTTNGPTYRRFVQNITETINVNIECKYNSQLKKLSIHCLV